MITCDWSQVPEALAARVHDCFHLPEVRGSDHCPVGLVLEEPLDAPRPTAVPIAAATAEAAATAVGVSAGGGETVVMNATAVAAAVAEPTATAAPPL